MKLINLAFLTAVVFLLNAPTYAATNECGDNASLSDAGYLISASGNDDTETIQCALDSAASQGLNSVKLDIGEFSITGLRTNDFVGIFEGTTRAGTVLMIENESALCGDDSNDAASLIVFSGGTVSVRYMSIDVDRPCSRGVSYSVLEFTQASCENRTHFANVDRVDFVGASSAEDFSRAVKIYGRSECLAAGEGPLGTFKLNRSTINGFYEGLRTGMLGEGQVDINFNEITDVQDGIIIFDANQSTTITGNLIRSAANGVWVATGNDWAPSQNRTVIHNNTFETIEGGSYYYGVDLSNYTTRAAHSAVLTNNTFNLVDTGETYGIYLGAIDGALVSSNTLNGSAFVGIAIVGFDLGKLVSGTAVIANKFNQTNNGVDENGEGVDIVLSEDSTEIIIGPQSANTLDLGVNNEVL